MAKQRKSGTLASMLKKSRKKAASNKIKFRESLQVGADGLWVLPADRPAMIEALTDAFGKFSHETPFDERLREMSRLSGMSLPRIKRIADAKDWRALLRSEAEEREWAAALSALTSADDVSSAGLVRSVRSFSGLALAVNTEIVNHTLMMVRYHAYRIKQIVAEAGGSVGLIDVGQQAQIDRHEEKMFGYMTKLSPFIGTGNIAGMLRMLGLDTTAGEVATDLDGGALATHELQARLFEMGLMKQVAIATTIEDALFEDVLRREEVAVPEMDGRGDYETIYGKNTLTDDQ